MHLFSQENARYDAEIVRNNVQIARTVTSYISYPKHSITQYHDLTYSKPVYAISVDTTENMVIISFGNDEHVVDCYSFSEIESMFVGVDKPVEQDNVNHPAHYQSKSGLETIDVIEAFTEGLNGIEAVCTGNALKYLCRWKHKNGVEDLKKATWYIRRLIDIKEANK